MIVRIFNSQALIKGLVIALFIGAILSFIPMLAVRNGMFTPNIQHVVPANGQPLSLESVLAERSIKTTLYDTARPYWDNIPDPQDNIKNDVANHGGWAGQESGGILLRDGGMTVIAPVGYLTRINPIFSHGRNAGIEVLQWANTLSEKPNIVLAPSQDLIKINIRYRSATSTPISSAIQIAGLVIILTTFAIMATIGFLTVGKEQTR